ncbi:uncharacterized protein RHOBADRAFT_30943 [Rhodotorula graminis WP1]|uniref:Protein kinase domain-containing protein n=1 Tax=Rhodotorula graminis (strain WP1) TaxID=578459 RepID=A0A0P9GFD7_RHOGW|nr:uncharacterized protein RHOBADRAFT_30943 [Rhodotorula graminis WP1]KPV71538.1 hypothetical protein RHOBADRAFT_30943 [Rhodotorula graminis WP1]
MSGTDDEGEVDGDEDDDEGDETPPAEAVGTIGPPPSVCPLCLQDLPRGPGSPSSRAHRRPRATLRGWLLPLPAGEHDGEATESEGHGRWSDSEVDLDLDDRRRTVARGGYGSRTVDGQSYFDLLSEVNSRATTPSSTGARARALPTPTGAHETVAGAAGPAAAGRDGRLDEGQMNEGYFARFFEELQLLGKGGQGSVYLVRHVLNGEALGLYACKKIPVGDSTPSLLSILREVHLLESATHANITRYHHAWLETSPSRSAFAPPVPTLHILMEFANGGSLQGFVDARKGTSTPTGEEGGRERARRARREGRERAVHLLRVEDIMTLFQDIVEGLSFLHGRNILHLDLKAENVLLHWDDDALLPTCKLSDFGNATSDSYHAERRGGSGTLLYTPPEAFFLSPHTGQLPPPDRATDMWALGLVLYLLCYFALPYASAEGDDTGEMEDEVKRYGGFHPFAPLPPAASARHDLPPSLLALLQALIHRSPTRRPLCERVLRAIDGVRIELKRGWRSAGRDGEGEEVVLAAPRGRWAAKQSFVSERPPLWRPQRGRSVSRLESARLGDRAVEVEVEEPESRDDSEWRVSPPLQRRPASSRTSSTPSLLSRSRSSSLPPLPPPSRPPLPLPPPSITPPSRPSTPPTKQDAAQRPERPAVVGSERQRVARSAETGIATAVALSAAMLKLFFLARLASSSPAPPTCAPPHVGPTACTTSVVPLSVVALLVLETALDFALADPSWTAAIALVHVVALRWL